MDDTEKYIAAEEGYRQFPYRCTAGKLTIGSSRSEERRVGKECRSR